MRCNAITGERVLEMDARGHRLAAREMTEKWDSEGLFKQAENFAHEVWLLNGCPPGWDVTIERECPQEFPEQRRYRRVA